ncbi:MAG: glycerophosphodiester phosphodiesterase [Caldilineales bacterium]|nr:glycerophosphodiester phosphodiesterase [Caldilineales bacterium]
MTRPALFPTFTAPRPLVFGHRGASAHAPENTLPAFILAADMGAHGIEFDVQISADGKLIIHHDHELGRTAPASGRLRDWKFADLRALDVGAWFDARFTGARMPTPEEVVEEVGSRLLLNFELVNPTLRPDGSEALLADLFRRMNLCDRAMISSFSPLSLAAVKRLQPRIPLGALWGPSSRWLLRAGWWRRLLDPAALHPQFSLITPVMAARAHARGQRLHTWTVNEPADIARMRALGVDMIMGDWVDRMLAAA